MRLTPLWGMVLLTTACEPPSRNSLSTLQAAEQDRISTIEHACDSCRVVLHRIARLGSPDDPVSLDLLPAAVWLRGDNKIIVGQLLNRGELAVYDSSGRYLQNIGRYGEGPTEITAIRKILQWADTVHVFQETRVTMIGRDLVPIRSVRLPLPPREVTILADGSFLLADQFPSVSAPRIARVSRNGDVERINVDTSSYIGGLTAGDNGFWALSLNSYILTEYSFDGAVRRRITRDVEWFPAWSRVNYDEPILVRPKPRGVSLWYDTQGLMWTLILVPDEHWEKVKHGDAPSFARLFDTVIEVLDTESAQVLATFVTDAALWEFSSERLVYGLDRDEKTGSVLIDLYELGFER